MKTKIENISGCSRMLNLEVSAEELKQTFDQVYADIGKVARVPGFRPGRVPRDLLETYYENKAREEVIKRAIPEYYLKALREEGLAVVAHPEIENVQFKNHSLYFSARVDVKPQVKLKNYKGFRIIKKKIKIEETQVDEVLQRLRQSKVKELEGKSSEELKEAIRKNLQADAQIQVSIDLERQILDELLKRASLDIPQSLVNRQRQELFNQFKLNRILQGEKKEDVESKEKQLQDQAQIEAMRRIKLSFILEEIAQRENIQASEEDLEKRIEAIAQRSGKGKDELRGYLDRENMFPGLKAELRDRKTIEFLLKEARVEEEGGKNGKPRSNISADSS